MKKTIFLLITILAATTGFAQDRSNDSIRNKVREIKLNEGYVYAESGSMAGFAEAKLAAAEKLHTAAITLMAEQLKGKEEMKDIWAKAEKQKQFMEYNNGSLFKVLAYVPKSSLIEIQPKTEPANAATAFRQPGLIIAPIAEDTLTNASSMVEADSIIHIVAQQTGQAVTPEDSHIQKEKTYNVDENTAALILKMLPIAASKHSSTEKQNTQQEPANETQSPAEWKANGKQTAGTVEAPDPWISITENTRRVLTDLLAMETYESAMIYLSAMKEDGRLMFGSLKKAIRPERSYLLIIKDGKVETVLSKGSGERTNLKSLKQESIRKYIGYGIVWIQVFDKN